VVDAAAPFLSDATVDALAPSLFDTVIKTTLYSVKSTIDVIFLKTSPYAYQEKMSSNFE
jgi:hypothetical protein